MWESRSGFKVSALLCDLLSTSTRHIRGWLALYFVLLDQVQPGFAGAHTYPERLRSMHSCQAERLSLSDLLVLRIFLEYPAAFFAFLAECVAFSRRGLVPSSTSPGTARVARCLILLIASAGKPLTSASSSQ